MPLLGQVDDLKGEMGKTGGRDGHVCADTESTLPATRHQVWATSPGTIDVKWRE